MDINTLLTLNEIKYEKKNLEIIEEFIAEYEKDGGKKDKMSICIVSNHIKIVLIEKTYYIGIEFNNMSSRGSSFKIKYYISLIDGEIPKGCMTLEPDSEKSQRHVLRPEFAKVSTPHTAKDVYELVKNIRECMKLPIDMCDKKDEIDRIKKEYINNKAERQLKKSLSELYPNCPEFLDYWIDKIMSSLDERRKNNILRVREQLETLKEEMNGELQEEEFQYFSDLLDKYSE